MVCAHTLLMPYNNAYILDYFTPSSSSWSLQGIIYYNVGHSILYFTILPKSQKYSILWKYYISSSHSSSFIHLLLFFFAFLFGCLVLPIRPTDRALPTIFTRFTWVQPTNMYLYLPFTNRYFEFSIWEEKVQGTQQDLLSSFTTIIIIGPLFCMADPRDDDDDNDVAVCVVCKHQVQISCIPHHTK